MRSIVTGVLFILQLNVSGQAQFDSIAFSNTFTFNNGIYTSLEELKANKPKFPGCALDLEKSNATINTANLYYTNTRQTRMQYTAPLYATVVEGHVSIFYKNKLSALFLRGAISTFILQEIVTTTHYQQQPMGYGYPGYGPSVPVTTSHIETNIYLMDYETGMILKVNRDNLAPIIYRDPELYESFKKIRGDANNKKSYPFISQYNSRNPVYIVILRTENTEQE